MGDSSLKPDWKKTATGYRGVGFRIGEVSISNGVLTVNNVRHQLPIKATFDHAEGIINHLEQIAAAKDKDSAEQTQRDVTELIACGRIQDAIDRVEAYLTTSTVRAHTLNQIKKLERLGIVAGAKFIDLEGDRYRPIEGE